MSYRIWASSYALVAENTFFIIKIGSNTLIVMEDKEMTSTKIYDIFKEAAKSSTVPTTFEKMNLVRFSDGDKNYEVYFITNRIEKQ